MSGRRKWQVRFAPPSWYERESGIEIVIRYGWSRNYYVLQRYTRGQVWESLGSTNTLEQAKRFARRIWQREEAGC